ncbi:hypothetical protein K5P26_02950 [Sphingopyxis sp. XHP0097]|uniref:Lipoprotein n=1 Tax=Sphingopyxis jiangsuensis TaxID=2871171 RepID=A0ABS7MAQ8_9SPHN|nr:MULTISPECIES: hypothetical protein [Sphingopyxis]MBY4636095.1 hypothetical protein [Sphingopyxis jiangsuensis]
MRALPYIAALLLGACKEEPDFDARYDAASKEIEARAKALDAAVGAADEVPPGASESGTIAESPPDPALSGR